MLGHDKCTCCTRRYDIHELSCWWFHLQQNRQQKRRRQTHRSDYDQEALHGVILAPVGSRGFASPPSTGIRPCRNCSSSNGTVSSGLSPSFSGGGSERGQQLQFSCLWQVTVMLIPVVVGTTSVSGESSVQTNNLSFGAQV